VPQPASAALAAGTPKLLSIPEFVDSQRMGREGVKTSPIGCSGATQARMIQVRDPLAAHTHADADEVLYDVAGDATIRMGGKDQAITSGWLVVVPRGTEHSVTRAGRNPVILVSVVGGPPCDQRGSE
jgi:mannose-6-phosphate isomerase-like protein (cupin superfamily)